MYERFSRSLWLESNICEVVCFVGTSTKVLQVGNAQLAQTDMVDVANSRGEYRGIDLEYFAINKPYIMLIQSERRWRYLRQCWILLSLKNRKQTPNTTTAFECSYLYICGIRIYSLTEIVTSYRIPDIENQSFSSLLPVLCIPYEPRMESKVRRWHPCLIISPPRDSLCCLGCLSVTRAWAIWNVLDHRCKIWLTNFPPRGWGQVSVRTRTTP
jgi:hypothetical protein